MTRKSFAGMYRCSCGYKGAQYFFDSKPTETVCGRCDGTAKLVREIDNGGSKVKAGRKKRVAAAA